MLCPAPKDLPHPGMELVSLMSSALAGTFSITPATWKVHITYVYMNIHDLW